MKQFSFALLILMFVIVACARSINAQPTSTTDAIQSLTFDGLQRTFIIHLPTPFEDSHPLPLVFDFHGGGGNAQSQMRVSGFNDLANEKSFIVIYPNGSGFLGDKILTWNGGTCCGYSVKKNIDDVGLIAHVELLI